MDQSVDGNDANARQGVIQLSSFFVQRPDGIYADLKKFSEGEFASLVDTIFAAGTYFVGLDYVQFSRLLYDYDPMRDPAPGMVRIAADIALFSPERRSLYKSVKIADGSAEYYFEPVYLEDPAPAEDGAVPERKRATLDFDEFVADMWNKGVRFGIDVAAVRSAIDYAKTERVVVARRREPVLGKAADVKELSAAIHRDNAPRQTADGRVDLRQFTNRFPQIKAGAQLMKKVPRVMGEWGWEISGNPIKPPIPLDFEMGDLAGPGTDVERTAAGEIVVARRDGFLNLDRHSNQISVTEKIINREGVSVRTTGDLQLSGSEYEEFGEVQERRVVEGRNITVHADVYGSVSSLGGNIVLDSNLVGGSAVSLAGDILIKGVVSRAVVHAKRGGVTADRAENSVIVGSRVVLQSATNCDILADEISIVDAAGCAIAARSIRIENAAPSKQGEMLLFARLPDLARYAEERDALTAERDQVAATRGQSKAEMETTAGQPEVRNYLLLAGKLKRKEAVLNAEQKANFAWLGALVAPLLKALNKHRVDIARMEARLGQIEQRIAEVAVRRGVAMEGVAVRVDRVGGELLVSAMTSAPDLDDLARVSPKELKSRLRSAAGTGDRIFAGRSGTVDWHYTEGKTHGDS